MRDFELYQAVLGLQAPWTVVNVELDLKEQQVTVTVEAGPGPYPCPECRELVPGYDRKRRRWRHLESLPVHDVDPGGPPPRELSDPWGQADRGALGRAWQSVHRLVRAPGH
ncbi:MAG: hypothetical protein KatS3mg082_0334 [Nitrospiraceae bacterium]|nr:MAG: hypothetical protein KatS3mg082_0334 [Nitrospiraceae bacterium]